LRGWLRCAALQAYSVEQNRGHDNANISAYDMTDSFLRQYEMGFVQGEASGVMCSYNLIDGTPNCASPALLNHQIRNEWGRSDALVVSDCGALGNMRADPTNWSPTEVVANSLNAGLDLNTGNMGASVRAQHTLRAPYSEATE
jgi:beta-glucosidase-like glycosyl hydrolase